MDRVARNLVDVAISQIPFYASALEANAAGVIERIVRCTGNLFTRPYDETWLAETIERMEYEQTHGFDVRARIAVNRLILSDFTRVLARRYRFFGARGAARHMDIATRVLLHDGSLAANLHFAGNMRKARGTSEDLTRSLETFELATVETRTSVSKGAECLRETSQNLRTIFDAIGNEAARAVEASVATATDVQEAAGATDRLSFAIEELEHESASSTAQAAKAAEQMKDTNATIQSLSAAVGRIGSVVVVIADVARQTNLLALNAAIEAARAGEAGRGFAVVAQEVKALADETSAATAQIADLIETIQDTTKRAVVGIACAGHQIEGVAETSRRLTSAVGKQTASADDIRADGSRHRCSRGGNVGRARHSFEQHRSLPGYDEDNPGSV